MDFQLPHLRSRKNRWLRPKRRHVDEGHLEDFNLQALTLQNPVVPNLRYGDWRHCYVGLEGPSTC